MGFKASGDADAQMVQFLQLLVRRTDARRMAVHSRDDSKRPVLPRAEVATGPVVVRSSWFETQNKDLSNPARCVF